MLRAVPAGEALAGLGDPLLNSYIRIHWVAGCFFSLFLHKSHSQILLLLIYPRWPMFLSVGKILLSLISAIGICSNLLIYRPTFSSEIKKMCIQR